MKEKRGYRPPPRRQGWLRERALLLQVKAGDEAAQASFTRDQVEPLAQLSLALTGRQEAARALLLESLTRGLQTSAARAEEVSLHEWLAARLLETWYRRPRPRPAGKPDNGHGARELQQAVADLPDAWRSAWAVIDAGGHALDSAARILDLTEGAVSMRLHCARLQLARGLGDASPEPSASPEGNS